MNVFMKCRSRRGSMYVCRSLRWSVREDIIKRSLSSGSDTLPSIEELLSSEHRAETVRRLERLKTISPRRVPPATNKEAAVLVPLCVTDGRLSLLYTLRRSDLKRHSGQVSFPGGVRDDTDPTLVDTALRETEEELGIDRSKVDVWGSASFILGIEFTVLPVLGDIGPLDPKDLRPNPDEVELPFVVPLEHFVKPENCGQTQFRLGEKTYTLPTYINAPCRIWGITALITHLILTSFLPNHYKHKVHHVPSLLPPSPTSGQKGKR